MIGEILSDVKDEIVDEILQQKEYVLKVPAVAFLLTAAVFLLDYFMKLPVYLAVFITMAAIGFMVIKTFNGYKNKIEELRNQQ